MLLLLTRALKFIYQPLLLIYYDRLFIQQYQYLCIHRKRKKENVQSTPSPSHWSDTRLIPFDINSCLFQFFVKNISLRDRLHLKRFNFELPIATQNFDMLYRF